MRHGKTVNHLSRTKSHRDALLKNLAISLIKAKRIETTLAKAKALRMYVEPLITKSKDDSTHSRRTVFSYLQDKESIKILFSEIAEKVAERNGGYTRIIKLGQRQGDNAVVALIELVDFNENLVSTVSDDDAKAKRSRRAKTKKTTDTVVAAAAPTVSNEGSSSVEEVIEAPVEAVEAPVEAVVEAVEAPVEAVVEAPVEAIVEVAEAPIEAFEEVVEAPVEAIVEVAEAPIEAFEEVVEAPVKAVVEVVETPVEAIVEEDHVTQETATEVIANGGTDDLKKIEGIGPKIEEIFNVAGILTFADLASTSAERLKELLEAAGPQFNGHDPATWSAQSEMARDGKWDELKAWQDELNGGK
jgi:large subunit ribosomal protein L17